MDPRQTPTEFMVLFRSTDWSKNLSFESITLEHANEADRRKHEDMGVVDGWGSSLECLERFLETPE